MPKVYDAIVIGATVSGLTSAITLARCGVKVIVLDSFDEGSSVLVGHGLATVALGDDLNVGQTEDETLLRRLGRILDAQSFVADIADTVGLHTDTIGFVERTVEPDDRLDEERNLLRRLGAKTVSLPPAHLGGVSVGSGYRVADQLMVDPIEYGKGLREVALACGVTFSHRVTVTRLRRRQLLHAVHYRSQLAWENTMFAEWAPRVIDTQAISPWGRHARPTAPLTSPVMIGEGIDLAAPVALRDTPARLLRPFRDKILVVGHPVPAAALETATMGLRHWLTERLGVNIRTESALGLEPSTLGSPSEGAAPIPGAFWAGGNGLWELGRGTAAGLAIARRLLSEPDAEQRLPVLSRLRAGVRRNLLSHLQ